MATFASPLLAIGTLLPFLLHTLVSRRCSSPSKLGVKMRTVAKSDLSGFIVGRECCTNVYLGDDLRQRGTNAEPREHDMHPGKRRKFVGAGRRLLAIL